MTDTVDMAMFDKGREIGGRGARRRRLINLGVDTEFETGGGQKLTSW